MRSFLFPMLLVLGCSNLSAKKVKFAVDMMGQTVSSNGVHITGDFQAAAGLGADWDPGTALMTKEGTGSVYSIVVNIPAFRKYEYKFLNGDQTYEAEFVPDESRVGYDFVDNRWLYVDSLSNDTTFAGAIMFAGNAPSGKSLVRYKVYMGQAGATPPSGVHLGTSYQANAYDPLSIRLYSFGYGVYEVIHYLSNDTYNFIYYNGNSPGSAENVPGACATNGKRSVTVSTHTVLTQVCFSSCSACIGLGIAENRPQADFLTIYPNPASSKLHLASNETTTYTIKDMSGRDMAASARFNNEQVIDISGLTSGIYIIHALNSSGASQISKLVVQ